MDLIGCGSGVDILGLIGLRSCMCLPSKVCSCIGLGEVAVAPVPSFLWKLKILCFLCGSYDSNSCFLYTLTLFENSTASRVSLFEVQYCAFRSQYSYFCLFFSYLRLCSLLARSSAQFFSFINSLVGSYFILSKHAFFISSLRFYSDSKFGSIGSPFTH